MTCHRFRPPRQDALVSEAQIREVRALYDIAGWKPRHIVERTGLELAAVNRIARGITGGKIFVTLKDLPEGVEPLAEFRR